MKTTTLKIFPLLAALGVACISPATAAVSDTVGYNSITCLANSDTIVGVPLRQAGSIKGVVSSISAAYIHDNDTPGFTDDDFDAVDMTLTSSPSDTVNSLELTHYFQFTGNGVSKNGQYFMIMRNDGTTITIDPNGATFPVGATGGGTVNSVLIAKYWTLNDLFPPAEATTAWDVEGVPNGHAIVESNGTALRFRKTQLFIPTTSNTGINFGPSKTLYISGGEWLATDDTPNAGLLILLPDSQFTLRHPTSVQATEYTCIGEVDDGSISIPFQTSSTTANDYRLSLPRPINVALTDLGLTSSGAFLQSNGTALRFRKDQLYVFDNSVAGINKAPADTYYYDSVVEGWRSTTGDVLVPNAVIPAGSGFLIRKARTTVTEFTEWKNDPTY